MAAQEEGLQNERKAQRALENREKQTKAAALKRKWELGREMSGIKRLEREKSSRKKSRTKWKGPVEILKFWLEPKPGNSRQQRKAVIGSYSLSSSFPLLHLTPKMWRRFTELEGRESASRTGPPHSRNSGTQMFPLLHPLPFWMWF